MIKLRYTKKMLIVGEYFFEEDAKKIVDFQNKNQVWSINGGIPDFLSIRK